jgi:hypothetical protein
MGKVALAVIEAKVEGVIGKDAIKEIKSPVIQRELHEALVKALVNAEKRLIAESPDNDIIIAISQLPINSITSLKPHLWDFFENPLSPQLYDAIYRRLKSIIPNSINKTKLAEVMGKYFLYFREEAILIPEIAQKLSPLATIRIETNTARSADALEHLVDLVAAKRIDTLPINYDGYIKFLINKLNEWQSRYAPMFAKFKSFTLFARVTQRENKFWLSGNCRELGIYGGGSE